MNTLRKTIRELIEEAISLDVKPGDVILTGRFKNKRKVVKTIGTDKYGQPTINGKSILKFKIEKKMSKKHWSAKSREELQEIRKSIRNLLITESVCAGATAKIQQGLDKIEELDLRVIITPEWAGVDFGFVVLLKDSNDISMGQFEVTTNPEASVFITSWTEVNPSLRNTGVGSVLYDVAVEVASKRLNYLTCDRTTVSKDARKMWAYYNESDDYEAYQLDTPDGHFTPDDPDDDIDQRIFYRTARKTLGKYRVGNPTEYENDFMASPYTKAYRKKRITTIPCLGDRYIEDEEM